MRTLIAVALLLTFTGSAHATSLVTGRQVKDETVHGRDLRDGSVAGIDVRDRGLEDDDLADGPVVGPAGDRGAPGAPGSSGALGPTGLHGIMVQGWEHGFVIPAGGSSSNGVRCPDDTFAVAGGFTSAPDDRQHLQLQQSAPEVHGFGWGVQVVNLSNERIRAYPWAVCAALPLRPQTTEGQHS